MQDSKDAALFPRTIPIRSVTIVKTKYGEKVFVKTGLPPVDPIEEELVLMFSAPPGGAMDYLRKHSFIIDDSEVLVVDTAKGKINFRHFPKNCS